MVLHSAKIVHRRKNGDKKSAMGNFFFLSPFSPGTNIFFKFSLLVSNVKLCEIYDTKEKVAKKFFTWEKRRRNAHWLYCLHFVTCWLSPRGVSVSVDTVDGQSHPSSIQYAEDERSQSRHTKASLTPVKGQHKKN